MLQIRHRREQIHFSKFATRGASALLSDEQGAALLEFAITLPLLVVFVVGIYDFSGAFNQKQKIAQAAQEGAIIAAAQPMSDIAPNSASVPLSPDSLQPVVTAIVKSLTDSAVLPNGNQGSCGAPFTASGQTKLTWTYNVNGCSSTGDQLVITINRAWVCASGAGCTSAPPVAVGTEVTVRYPYHWQFNSVIQLLVPGASYAAKTPLTENATAHNQM